RKSTLFAVLALGAPPLLPVPHPFVAVAYGSGRQAGEVRAATRLAEQLAPRVLAGHDPRQESPLPVVGSVDEDRGGGQRHPAPERHTPRAGGGALDGVDFIGPG